MPLHASFPSVPLRSELGCPTVLFTFAVGWERGSVFAGLGLEIEGWTTEPSSQSLPHEEEEEA